MSGRKHQSADEIPLIPMGDFKKAVRKVLLNTKVESDRRLERLETSTTQKERNGMKNITHKFAICAVLLFGCLLPVATRAQGNQGHHQSGIIGQIEQVPGPWNIRIVTVDGEFVADIQADDSGFFEVDLKPGTYVLTPFILSIDGTGVLHGADTTVTVEKKAFTTAELPIVIGPI